MKKKIFTPQLVWWLKKGLRSSSFMSITTLTVFAAIGTAVIFRSSAATSSLLPQKLVGGYWQMWQGPNVSEITTNAPQYNLQYAAFALGSDGNGNVSFSPAFESSSALKTDIAASKAKGSLWLISIGGGGDSTIRLTNETQATNMFNSLVGIIDSYGFQGIDYDLECGSGCFNPSAAASLAGKLKAKYGSSFIVSAAPRPYEMRGGGIYAQFAQQAGDNMDLFGLQFYDFNEANDANQLSSIINGDIASAVSQGIPASKILIGCITYSGYGMGHNTVDVYKNIFLQQQQKYPSLRGVFIWETSLDKKDGWVFAHTMGPAIGALPATTTPNPTPTPTPTKPVVSLNSPVSGATLKGVTSVNGTATDSAGVTKVELVVDGAVKATNNSSSANFSWNSAQVSDGQHSMLLRAYNASGAQAVSSTITVKVANATTTTVAAPTISSLSAVPGTVLVGGSSRLTWATANTSGCSVSPGGPQNTTANSWQTVTLASVGIKTYILDCQNSAGAHVTKTVTITIAAPQTAPGKPVLAASAATIPKGGSVTLAWYSSGATSCTLNPGSITSTGSSSRIVSNIQSDTTFSVVCVNSTGTTASDPVTVHIGGAATSGDADPVIVSFTATPDKVSSGQYTMLAWSTTGTAGGCGITPTPLKAAVSNGTWRSPALTASTSYTLTCANTKGKTVSKSVGVSVNGATIPSAPVATTPANNATDATATKVKASNGQTIVNGAVATQVSGLVALDPSNITDVSKEQTITKVEYYDGETLVQTDAEAPFALDSAKLKNGQYTVTERTYFNDGSQSEVTKVIDIANSIQVAQKKSASGSAGVAIFILVLVAVIGAGGIFWFIRRRGMRQAQELAGYGTGEDFFQQYGSATAPQTPVQPLQYGQQSSWPQPAKDFQQPVLQYPYPSAQHPVSPDSHTPPSSPNSQQR